MKSLSIYALFLSKYDTTCYEKAGSFETVNEHVQELEPRGNSM